MSKEFIKKGGYSRLWTEKTPPLNSIDIELTERCTNSCIHCYINLSASDKNALKRELSTEEWKDIIQKIADLGALEIRFTGGEPLLRPDFKELYIFTRKLGIKVLLFTNATLITNEIAELFAQIPPLQDIEITVYGMKKSSYEKVSGVTGSFTKFMNGIKNLKKKKVPFILKGAVLPPNRNEMKEFEKWAMKISNLNKKPQYSMFFDLRGRRDNEEKNKSIKNLRLSPDQGLEILTADKKLCKKEMVDFVKTFLKIPNTKLFNCGAGVGGSIDAYGVYQPCLLLRHPDVTFNLKKFSLKRILNEKIQALKHMEAVDPAYLEKCAKCFLKGLCEQCPAKSWSEHGTLDTPVEYLCAAAHAQAQYLGLIEKDEKGWKVEDWEERIKKL